MCMTGPVSEPRDRGRAALRRAKARGGAQHEPPMEPERPEPAPEPGPYEPHPPAPAPRHDPPGIEPEPEPPDREPPMEVPPRGARRAGPGKAHDSFHLGATVLLIASLGASPAGCGGLSRDPYDATARATLRARAIAPMKGSITRGRSLFVSSECWQCHEVEGVVAPRPEEQIGDPLALRRAGNRKPTREALALSILDPSHELSPAYEERLLLQRDPYFGVSGEAPLRMESYDDALNDAQLADLVAFLADVWERPPSGK